MASDIIESIEEIYDAVGDPERWQLLCERVATNPKPRQEVQQHFEIARRAHERHMELASDVEALLKVHDQLALGALVVDRDGRLLRANVAANRLLAQGDGMVLSHERVEATNECDNTVLRDSIERGSAAKTEAKPSGSPFVVVTRADRQPLTVLVLRPDQAVARGFEDRHPVALLIIDPELATVPPAAVLRGLFGFTTREAEFATLLMKGLSVEDTAQTLGVAISTARTFLAQVTAKTDSHSQLELVKMLLAVPHAT